MASYNRVILIGNLTRDPELRYLPSNMPVCKFGLAINHRWRDKDGNQKEEVCFIDCSCFGKAGEIINQYMSKGRPLLVEGRLRLDSWTGQDGQKRSRHEVVVENFQFLGDGRRDEGQGAPAARSAPPSRNQAAPTPSDYGGGPASASQYGGGGGQYGGASGGSNQYDDAPAAPRDEEIPF